MRTDTAIKSVIRLVAFIATVAFIYHLSSALLFTTVRYDDTGIDQVSDSIDSGFGMGAYIWKGNQRDMEEEAPDDIGTSEEEQEEESDDADITEEEEEATGEDETGEDVAEATEGDWEVTDGDEAGEDAAENENGDEEAVVDEDIEYDGLSEEEEASRQNHDQNADDTIKTIAEHPKKHDRHRLSHVITDELRHKHEEAEKLMNEAIEEARLREEEEALKQAHQGNTDETIEVIAEHPDDFEQHSRTGWSIWSSKFFGRGRRA